MDADRIVGVCGNNDHVVGLLTVLDSYHIKARMPVLMALIFDDFTKEDYQEWKSSVFQGDAVYGCQGAKQNWSKVAPQIKPDACLRELEKLATCAGDGVVVLFGQAWTGLGHHSANWETIWQDRC